MNNSAFKSRGRRPKTNSSGPNRQRVNSGGRNQQARKNNTKSNIDPHRLIKQAVPLEETVYVATRSFATMPIHQKLKALLERKGYTQPTEIQDRTLENLVSGADLIGIAQTGTGKTGAFLIPLTHRMLEGERLQTLVLVPTRELAVQVEQEFKSMTHGLNMYSACFIGGTNIERDIQKSRRASHLVVATPGRLNDLYARRAIRLNEFDVLILDEFDRMLDMGFAPSVQKIVNAMSRRKQTLLFSATMDTTQQHLIDNMMQSPQLVKVSNGSTTGDHIEQDVIRVKEGVDKFDVLLDMVGQEEFDKVLLFAETRGWVKRLHKKLIHAGIKADLIHGDKSQNTRQRALEQFKQGRIQVLVATDVAARGLDVSDVTHVINYQLPRTYDSYIHRIGRTGRAGKCGKAYTFVD